MGNGVRRRRRTPNMPRPLVLQGNNILGWRPPEPGIGWLTCVSEECRTFLRVAAVVGPRFAPDDVARLLGRPVAALLPLVDEALRVGVLEARADLLAYRDTRRWREVVRTVPPPIVRYLRQDADTSWLTLTGPVTESAPAADPADGDTPAPGPAVVPAATVLSNVRWNAGEPTEALRFGWEAVRAIGSDTPPPWRPHARLALAYKLVSLRQPEHAQTLIGDAQEDVDRLGLAGYVAGPGVVRARLLAQAGRLAAARFEAQSALRVGERTEARIYDQLARSVLALTSLRAGDLRCAQIQVDLFRAEGGTRGWIFPVAHFEWVNFLVATELLPPNQALGTIGTMFPDLLDRSSLWYEEPAAAPWLVRLALAAGDTAFAATVVARVSQLAARFPDLSTVVVAARHAGALADDDVSGLESAADEHRDLWAAALAAEDLAIRLADRTAERDRSTHWLNVAVGGFGRLGARREVARTRDHLRRLDDRPTVEPAATTAHSGWDDLTETERTIAHLVSQGLTNRQVSTQIFLSPHTINYHLRQIFRKLAIKSRVELARIVPREAGS
jgi:DNA-binding CsgD family transcriptional regulator